MAERLQKIIAASGVMSRRAAEEAISAGRVRLNGKVAVLGERAENGDSILLDNQPIPSAEPKRYYILNKPRGYVCSLNDEKGRPSVRSLLPQSAGRVYPVGRLDIMSEGLLLLTNDGEFAQRCMHPSAGMQKTYRTAVSGEDLDAGIARLREPFLLDGCTVQAIDLQVVRLHGGHAVLEISVGEGRNREIRRMCEEAGLHVDRLIRVSQGSITLDGLPAGKFRKLTAAEIASVLGECRT